jgi:hypothetical protein
VPPEKGETKRPAIVAFSRILFLGGSLRLIVAVTRICIIVDKFERHVILPDNDSREFAEMRDGSARKGRSRFHLAYGGANTLKGREFPKNSPKTT